jgi:inorganic pyrophosphatase
MSRDPTDLASLPIEDPSTGDTLAVIETPRGSRNKYSYDPQVGAFRLKKVLPRGSIFPYDFGFIPSTRAADGDPLDVLVLLDEETPPGCLISVRVIGAIEAVQRETAGKWLRNDRLVAVATHAHRHSDAQSIKDLDGRMIQEIEAFFTQYNKLEGKEFRVIGRCGPKGAGKLLDEAARTARDPTAKDV